MGLCNRRLSRTLDRDYRCIFHQCVVLDDSAYVRFIPDSTNGVTAELTFLALDRTDSESSGSLVTISSSNQGDAGAYSSAEDTFTVAVTDENDRPILSTVTSPITLTTINEGDTDSIIYSDVVSISTTIGNTITEVDTGNSKGIAITDASSSNGHWEYSADGVNNWTQISGVATDTALLLDESYSCGLLLPGPDGVTATLDFVAWDPNGLEQQVTLPIQQPHWYPLVQTIFQRVPIVCHWR